MKEISAGGVVYRERPHGMEVLMIEDRFGRWTLPKGKKEAGETDEETALREILEETGIEGKIVSFLQTITYAYTHEEHGAVEKTVHYYLVRAISGEETPQLAEINGVVWCSLAEAWEKQTTMGYDNNDEVLKSALDKLESMRKDESKDER
ncbi:NUDIX hydrolase [Laceyella tengchongensis]|jgi:8-oxo-dGTP pyrophosphatase MutT (NUDIX family)|uniref:NUDIX domain-containing protein n=1 Tax=Laceyella tengchongensis TaxID=574699 RepID=A0AA45WLU9_9BACL|nr:NUDIX domain-containing protein [Laceyella tengchongensis]MRG29445.1 NUDIX domain-containing protein [Laceyella tengchongensis]SMP12612.1 NUDIX domain-containing protein [Laceyella tengchongensis]